MRVWRAGVRVGGCGGFEGGGGFKGVDETTAICGDTVRQTKWRHDNFWDWTELVQASETEVLHIRRDVKKVQG